MELTPISLESLPKLVELYRKDWPKHIISYNSIRILHEWLVKDPNLDCINIFTLGDDWKETGTFLWTFFNNVYFDTLESSHESLITLLKNFKWSNQYIVNAVRSDLEPTYTRVMQKLKISTNSDLQMHLFIFRGNVKDEIEFPKGFYCEKLYEKHAKKIEDLWDSPSKSSHSLTCKKLYIKFNPSSGLFDEKGELIGWLLFDVFGLRHSGHVIKEHRGKGYLALIGWFLSKQTNEKGFERVAMVTEDGILKEHFRKSGTELDTYKWFKLQTKDAKL